MSTDAVLVELLAIGPLVAAARSTPGRRPSWAPWRWRCLPLGLTNHMFTSLQHVVGMITVAVGSVLAVALARLHTNREELLRLEQTARMEATRARDELQAMLSGIADAVTGQAPDGRLVYANDAALELLGFDPRDELLAVPPVEIMARYEILDGSPARSFRWSGLPGRRALMGEGAERGDHPLPRAWHGGGALVGVKATPVVDEGGWRSWPST